MKRKIKYMGCLLLLLTTLTIFSSCNNEDDVLEILTGKTWRMSRLTTDGSSNKFGNFWDSEDAYNTSFEYYNASSSFYTITFDGAEIDGEVVGNQVSIRGIDSSASGTWSANGSSNAMSLSLTVSGTESDVLASIFMNGIQNIYKYSGDINNLNLYFKDEGTTYVIGFTPLN